MKTTKFSLTENGLSMELTVLIPLCDKQECRPVDRVGLLMDITGAFSERIIKSLERRMEACQQNLLFHLKDVIYNDGNRILYKRKNGTLHSFNTPSFEAMKDAVKALTHGEYKSFVSNKVWIDQTLKALLNDTEQDHSDSGGFAYSDLVSMLCELQWGPQL